MSDHVLKTIDDLRLQLRDQEGAVLNSKKLINSLSKMVGLPEPYIDIEASPASAIGSIRADQFYGQPLAAAVRQILEMRKAANLGPAAVADIHETLVRGGYLFDTKDGDNARRGLRVSLTKNPIFHRVPTGEYGLTAWYPNIKEKRAAAEADHDGSPEAETPTRTISHENALAKTSGKTAPDDQK